MKPYKATRSRTVSNSVLIHAREELIPHLGPLFQATNTLQYYPQEWANDRNTGIERERKKQESQTTPPKQHGDTLYYQTEWPDYSTAARWTTSLPCARSITYYQPTISEQDQDAPLPIPYTC